MQNLWNPGKIDYEKLIRDFGSTKISKELLERMRKLTVGSGEVLPTNLPNWRPPKWKMAEDRTTSASLMILYDFIIFYI